MGGDLAGAARDFAIVADCHVAAAGAAYPQSVFGLVLTHLAGGRHGQAAEHLEAITALALETANTELLAEAEIVQALAALRAGRPGEAARWIAPYTLGLPIRPMYSLHTANMTVVRVLLGLEASQRPPAWASLLQKLLAVSQATHNRRIRLEALAFSAILDAENGDWDAGLLSLAEALCLAEPGGSSKYSSTCGLSSIPCWRASIPPSPPAVTRILAGDGWRVNPAEGQADAQTASTGSARRDEPPLAEALTFREMEVLRLLGRQMTNREIAQALSISPETVKRHTANIYHKLRVHNRRQAVVRAAARGLSPDA